MGYQVSIYYRNANAHFELLREQKRIYTAELLQYDGFVENTPPKNILLLRGLHHWWGSAPDQDLVKALGEHISSLSENHLFFTESDNAIKSIIE